MRYEVINMLCEPSLLSLNSTRLLLAICAMRSSGLGQKCPHCCRLHMLRQWGLQQWGLCDEYILATVHCMTLYIYSLLYPIRAFPSEGRTSWVRRYCSLKVSTLLPSIRWFSYVMPRPPRISHNLDELGQYERPADRRKQRVGKLQLSFDSRISNSPSHDVCGKPKVCFGYLKHLLS
jgi:hypothetical protein